MTSVGRFTFRVLVALLLSTPCQAWQGAAPIDAGPGYGAYTPQIVIGSNNEAICVFGQYDGTSDRIYANHFSGGAWKGVVPIDAGTGHKAFDPHIAIGPNNKAICVFRQWNGMNWRILANRL